MSSRRARIAIVGAGISGNTAAWQLQHQYDVTVFEASHRPGGHTRTSDVLSQGQRYAIDTGFIVYNRETYPTFCRMLDELGVPTEASDMSFGASCERTGLEYGTTSLNALFAQKRNLLSASYLAIWRDFLRLGRAAQTILETESPEVTLGDYLEAHGYSERFREHFIVPMAAAIWSATAEHILAFPLTTFVRFMSNHHMLSTSGQPRWRVISGGSRSYVNALYAAMNVELRCGVPVREVARDRESVTIELADNSRHRFDAVVMATHSDQALKLLAAPTAAEASVLASIRYQPNEAILHTDPSVLPAQPAAWASWNYRIPREPGRRVSVTYDMNRLQNLDARERFLVTLNRDDLIDPARIVERVHFEHPIFDGPAVAAQQRWHEISGQHRTYYCGAYWRFGFHEDGAFSGLRAAEQLQKLQQPRIAEPKLAANA